MVRLSEILPTLCSEVQNLTTPKIWTFCPQKPRNAILMNSSLVHYPWPMQIQKDPKDPNLKLVLTVKSVYTYTFHRCCLKVLWFWLLCFRRFLRPSTAQAPQITKKPPAEAAAVFGVNRRGIVHTDTTSKLRQNKIVFPPPGHNRPSLMSSLNFQAVLTLTDCYFPDGQFQQNQWRWIHITQAPQKQTIPIIWKHTKEPWRSVSCSLVWKLLKKCLDFKLFNGMEIFWTSTWVGGGGESDRSGFEHFVLGK